MNDLWIFGYGSLVWRPDIYYAEKQPATVRNWTRRFWQGSTDHRGVPGAPGRVVTLVPEAGAVCWGYAYRIEAQHQPGVIAYLDHREKGGYAMHDVEIGLATDGRTVPGRVYVATSANPNWLGEAHPDDIAEQVRRSRGPSGTNIDYVMALAEALRAMGVDDPHVLDLADRVMRATGPPE